MHVILVHGWSVRDTSTYGQLPEWLARQSRSDGEPFQVSSLHLGKYITLDDNVTLDDVARAFHQALRDTLGNPSRWRKKQRIACITHSTGGPVVRTWLDLYYRGRLDRSPLGHFILLAPPNHGSALAQLGRSRLSRLKSLLQGAECGERILDWLELGSRGSWDLNLRWLNEDPVPSGVYPFVLTGQRIDRQLYDVLNAYTDEAGSDGVIRVAAANLNYGVLRLAQQGSRLKRLSGLRSPRVAFGVLPGLAHSGNRLGILRSVTLQKSDQHPTAYWIKRCLEVRSATDYRRTALELEQLCSKTQSEERKERVRFLLRARTYITNRYAMLVFRFVDDRGQVLTDYDLLLTAGPHYHENELPPGFFVDRQRNQNHHEHLTYYVDYDVMMTGLNHPRLQGRLGFRLVARPQSGLVHYRPVEFRSNVRTLARVLRPNETTLIEIQLQRRVDKAVFRLTDDLVPGAIDPRPSGQAVEA
jgi:hypothetical protein